MTNREKADNLFNKAENLLLASDSSTSVVAQLGVRGLHYAEKANCPLLYGRSKTIIRQLKDRS